MVGRPFPAGAAARMAAQNGPRWAAVGKEKAPKVRFGSGFGADGQHWDEIINGLLSMTLCQQTVDTVPVC